MVVSWVVAEVVAEVPGGGTEGDVGGSGVDESDRG